MATNSISLRNTILSILQISENFESRKIRFLEEIGFLRYFRFSQNSKANTIFVKSAFEVQVFGSSKNLNLKKLFSAASSKH